MKIINSQECRQYLHEWLKVKGWTREKIAKEIGASGSLIAGYIRGKSISNMPLKLLTIAVKEYHPVLLGNETIAEAYAALIDQPAKPSKAKGSCNCFKQVAILTMEIRELKIMVQELAAGTSLFVPALEPDHWVAEEGNRG